MMQYKDMVRIGLLILAAGTVLGLVIAGVIFFFI